FFRFAIRKSLIRSVRPDSSNHPREFAITRVPSHAAAASGSAASTIRRAGSPARTRERRPTIPAAAVARQIGSRESQTRANGTVGWEKTRIPGPRIDTIAGLTWYLESFR